MIFFSAAGDALLWSQPSHWQAPPAVALDRRPRAHAGKGHCSMAPASFLRHVAGIRLQAA